MNARRRSAELVFVLSVIAALALFSQTHRLSNPIPISSETANQQSATPSFRLVLDVNQLQVDGLRLGWTKQEVGQALIRNELQKEENYWVCVSRRLEIWFDHGRVVSLCGENFKSSN